MHEGHSDHDHHHHEHGPAGAVPGIKALLEYMVEHNKSHAGELAELAHKLYHADGQAAADLISTAVTDFEKGNEKLARALELVKGEQA
jgi:hypothetical protein